MSHHRRVIAQSLGVLLGLPILYVASSGPLLSLAMKWNSSQGIVGKRMLEIYHPLLEMKETNPLEPAWRAYLGLWGLHPFRVPLGIKGKVGKMLILPWSPAPGEHRRYYSPPSTTPMPNATTP